MDLLFRLWLALLLAVTLLGCSGGGGGNTVSQPPPGPVLTPIEIFIDGVEGGSSAAPGSTFHGTLHIRVLRTSNHLVGVSCQSSIPGVSINPISAFPATRSDGVYNLSFSGVVAASAAIGATGQLEFSAWDQSAGGKSVATSHAFAVADYPLLIQFKSLVLPAKVGPGEDVQGSAVILAQGPAGTTLALSSATSDAQIQAVTLTPSGFAVHEPKEFQVQVSLHISPEVLPNASLGIAVFVSTPSSSTYVVGWMQVADYPTFLLSGFQTPILVYHPGTETAQSINLYSSGGFSGPLTLSIEGLPQDVSVTWDDPSPVLGSGDNIRDRFRVSFPSTFKPRFMNPVLVISSGTQTRHYPFHLSNSGDPDFIVRPTASEFRMAPGTLQKFAVEVRSVRGFQGEVSLYCDGLDDQVGYAFSPATVTLEPGSSKVVDLYLETTPQARPYGFYINGVSGALVHTDLGILELTTLPSLEVNSDCSWMAVKVGDTATWKTRLRSINGYQGPVDLTGSVGLSGATPIQFTPAQVSIGPGEEVEVLCSSLIQDGIEGYIIRVAPDFTVASSSGRYAKIAIWPQNSPALSASVPDTIPKLLRRGTVTTEVPITSHNGLSQALDIIPFSWAYGAVGVPESCDMHPIAVAPGVDGKVITTLSDLGYQAPGTYTFQVGVATSQGQTPLRTMIWDIPFLLVDPLKPDWYAVAMNTDLRPSAPGPFRIPVKVGSLSGFEGTVRLGVEWASCAWDFDLREVSLHADEERVIYLTLDIPVFGAFDFEIYVTAESAGVLRRQKIHVALD